MPIDALRTAAVEDLHDRFQQFVDHCPASAYIKDAEGRFVWVNAYLQRVTGRPLEAWLGRSDVDMIGAADGERVRANDRAVLESGRMTSFVETLGEGDAKQTWLSYKFPLVGRGGPTMLAGMSINVSEQLRARDEVRRLNEELEARANELQTLLDLIPLGIYMAHDPEATRITGNRAASELIETPVRANLSLTAEPGHRPTPHKVLHRGRELPGPELPIQQAARGVEIRGEEFELVFEDGTHKTIFGYASPLRDGDQRVRGSVAAFLDITDRKRVEAERMHLIEQLREADRRKDEFLATLAHELRNPLAPIKHAVQIMRARGPQDPKLVWARDVIDRQVGHMARLLEDLLDVSRISRDKLELRREPVEIASVIDVAVETSRPLIESSHHTLSIHVPAETLQVHGDPVRLAQVFANLLNNAAKYTPEHGAIELTAVRDGADVVVSVRDNGIGIAAEALPRVFEMFSQAEPALARARGGLGIGLSLVRGLVELHGGTVSADSEGPGLGSVLTVRLPLSKAPSDVPDVSSSPKLEGSAQRVLVVDDNTDSADSLATLLELMGSEVKVAYEGEQALEIAAAFRPSVVLLDLGMPRMSGFDVCRRLRQEPWAKGEMIIAMTGWGQADDRQRTREAGFDHHLVKPVDYAQLAELLQARRSSYPGNTAS